jgi:hypothetical protein
MVSESANPGESATPDAPAEAGTPA